MCAMKTRSSCRIDLLRSRPRAPKNSENSSWTAGMLAFLGLAHISRREQAARPDAQRTNGFGVTRGASRARLPYLGPVHPPHDIGISSSAYAELLLPAALERIAAIAPAAEIRSFGLHTLLSQRNRRAALEAGLPCSVHGPFGYTDLGDVSEAARLEVLDEHRRHLEAAAEIGATLYLVHPDWRPDPGPRDSAVVSALERSFDAFLAAPPPELRHVHLHSNAGVGDLDDPHLPLGAGVVGASVVLELNN